MQNKQVQRRLWCEGLSVQGRLVESKADCQIHRNGLLGARRPDARLALAPKVSRLSVCTTVRDANAQKKRLDCACACACACSYRINTVHEGGCARKKAQKGSSESEWYSKLTFVAQQTEETRTNTNTNTNKNKNKNRQDGVAHAQAQAQVANDEAQVANDERGALGSRLSPGNQDGWPWRCTSASAKSPLALPVAPVAPVAPAPADACPA